jgi:endonuclease-3
MPSSEPAKAAEMRRAKQIARLLAEEYPRARPHLEYRSPFQLLVATILAAQCTDEMVNKVTPELFRRWPDPAALAAAPQEQLEQVIRSTGFYRNKTRSLLGMAAALVRGFGGRLPRTVEELTELPGVGRKTANVVAGHCFGVPAIIVDTHVKRLAGRLGLSAHSDPDKIERDLDALIPEALRTSFSQALNEHGRRVCTARKPACGRCLIARLCPYPASLRDERAGSESPSAWSAGR